MRDLQEVVSGYACNDAQADGTKFPVGCTAPVPWRGVRLLIIRLPWGTLVSQDPLSGSENGTLCIASYGLYGLENSEFSWNLVDPGAMAVPGQICRNYSEKSDSLPGLGWLFRHNAGR